MNDGSRGTPMVTAGLDLGDKYSYLCLIDTDNGKVVEEGRLHITLRGTEVSFRLRAADDSRIEVGTCCPR